MEGSPSLRWSHDTVRSHVQGDDHALVEHGLDEGAQLLGVGPVVALEEVDAELEHAVGVVDELGGAHELDAAQLLVVLAVLGHARHGRVAPEVLGLLRLGLGLEGEHAVEEPVPHGHGVDRSVVVHRAQRDGPPLVDEPVDLLGGHLDLGPLVDAVPHLCRCVAHRGERIGPGPCGTERRGAGPPAHRARVVEGRRSVRAGQVLDAVDEVRPQPVGLGRGPDVGKVAEELFEHDRDLAPGQVRAQAEVRARERRSRGGGWGGAARRSAGGPRRRPRRGWPSCRRG